MKKVLVVGLVLISLISCKKDCNCIIVQENGKLSYVKDVEVMNWKVVDTLGYNNDCNSNGDITYEANTLRTRVICD